MSRSGLLVLSTFRGLSDSAVSEILLGAFKHVNKNLYIHLAPLTQSNHIPLTSEIENTITKLYTKTADVCSQVDVRIILSNITNEMPFKTEKITLSKGFEVVLTEQKSESLFSYIKQHFNSTDNLSIDQVIEIAVDGNDDKDSCNKETLKSYEFSCLGGTFDRLHIGHKILLSKACLLTTKALTVGVTDDEMNRKKLLCELIEPIDERIACVQDFLKDIKPQLEYRVVPITDPFGPAITDPSLQCIVVSQETIKGGQAVNQKRQEQNMSNLTVEMINLVEDLCHTDQEEDKVSSSTQRTRLLGTLIQDPQPDSTLDKTPYIIGLTGGSASGKSSVCKRLEKLGAAVIDCDKLGHKAYLKGTDAFTKVVEEFGQDVVGEDGEINRRALGPKVFADKSKLVKLNNIVWPAIADMAKKEIEQHSKNGVKVVILDAAVLIEGGWNKMVHEVWTAIIPKEEAAKRIMERDGKTEEEAYRRLNSQLTNEERIKQTNVVLCTLWAYEITQKQVEKAWNLLLKRISLL